MYFDSKTYNSDLEILATNKNLVTFSTTVLAKNASKADTDGNKYVKAGSLLDEDGNVVNVSGDSLQGEPVGILYKTVNVNHGDQPGSLIVEGYLRADRVLDGFSENAITAIKKALPNIKFR